MEGTSHEGKGKFYHDALTLMTCIKTKQYIQDNVLLKYWLLPLEGLQAGTRYHNSIPDDSPELMPFDETLNMDIHSSARYQVAITVHLAKNDPKKFTFLTPKEVSSAYLQFIDDATGNTPSLHRIVQDCDKWEKSLEKIRQAGGKIVEGFGRNGHRRGHKRKRGGFREKKKQGPAKWVHSDTSGVTKHQLRESVAKVETNLNNIRTTSLIYATTSQSRNDTTTASTTTTTTTTTTDKTKSTRATFSPLTMIDFGSNIETDSTTESKGRKRKLAIAQSDNEDIEDEENYYERFDEEVLCVLLGLHENMGLS
jgi:hypothetical protein